MYKGVQKKQKIKIDNIVSSPRAKDFLIVVRQSRTRLHKGSAGDFSVGPISCQCGHTLALFSFEGLMKNTSNNANAPQMKCVLAAAPLLMEEVSLSSIGSFGMFLNKAV